MPTITGAPTTAVTVGSAYNFTPSAWDANGDPLVFSIQNKPSWASFDVTTGKLSGTPGAADTGTYSNVLILVSDGKANAALSAFTITVSTVLQGSVTLTWTAPTQNTDGTALTSLAGYRIYYGTDPTSLTRSVTVSSATATSFTVASLVPGTYYFAMVAFTATGTESDLTNTITVSI